MTGKLAPAGRVISFYASGVYNQTGKNISSNHGSHGDRRTAEEARFNVYFSCRGGVKGRIGNLGFKACEQNPHVHLSLFG